MKEYLRYICPKCNCEVTSGNTDLTQDRTCPRCKEDISFKGTNDKSKIVLYKKEGILN